MAEFTDQQLFEWESTAQTQLDYLPDDAGLITKILARAVLALSKRVRFLENEVENLIEDAHNADRL